MAKKRKEQKGIVEPVEPNLKVVEPVEPQFVEPSPKVEPTENNFVEPLKGVEPKHVEPVEPKIENVEPSENVEPCPRCSDFQNSISNFANLYQQEQEKVKGLLKTIREQEKQLKELQQPINPTIER
jgi:hypothetical protein